MSSASELDSIVKNRMSRYQRLLDNGRLTFHSYQYEGIEWCLRREIEQNHINNIKGGIVADEMGLGKTITMIGLMFVNIVNKTLIVVPPILMEQWYNQIYKITGHKPFIYHGLIKKKIEKCNNKNDYNSFMMARIVITTYNLVSISKKNNKISNLHKIKWGRVIFDEAHHLRNKNTTRFFGCFNIRSCYRWLLTGTPIQNKKADFVHLCYILSPEQMKNKDTDKEDLVKKIQEIHFLKRTKKMIGLDIEPLQENDAIVEWKSLEEKQFAQEIHSLIKVSKVDEKYLTKFAQQLGYGFNQGKKSMLMAVLRAKQSCIMPALMKNTVEWLVDTNKINKKYLIPIIVNGSGPSKLEKVLEKIIERKENKRGKLVFCQFTKEMNYLYEKLIEYGFTCCIIDGKCVGKNRISQLEKAFDVLILQIKTACEGLNLQEFYSEVYFVSPHWNPSVEDQAIGRCHRMGQKHQVDVFKFEMSGFDEENKTISLETHIKMVQEIKRNIRL